MAKFNPVVVCVALFDTVICVADWTDRTVPLIARAPVELFTHQANLPISADVKAAVALVIVGCVFVVPQSAVIRASA